MGAAGWPEATGGVESTLAEDEGEAKSTEAECRLGSVAVAIG